MQENIIVIYDKDELTIQTEQIINNGVLTLIDRTDYRKVIQEEVIANSDFIQIQRSLMPGKYEVRIVSATTRITKRITIKDNSQR